MSKYTSSTADGKGSFQLDLIGPFGMTNNRSTFLTLFGVEDFEKVEMTL